MTKSLRERTADASGAPDPSSRCQAKGCPNFWTIDQGEGRFCGAHFGADPLDWPAITAEQVEREAFTRPSTPEPGRIALLTAPDTHELAETVERLQQLGDVMRAPRTGNPKAWAMQLRARELAGEPLTQAQRTMWRAALRRGGVAAPGAAA